MLSWVLSIMHDPEEAFDCSVMFSGLTTVDFQRKLQKDDLGISIHAT